MNQKNDFIAVFDSGVGGISVLRHLLTELPNERFLYFGDSINAPYGVRPREEVEQLLARCYDDAVRILQENRALLDEIAAFLLAKETITGDELMAYVNSAKAE